MTASEMSTVLSAIESLGERLDNRIDRVEDTIKTKFTPLEEDLLERRGAARARSQIVGFSRASIALIVSIAGAAVAVASFLS